MSPSRGAKNKSINKKIKAMRRGNYIKNLEYNLFTNFGKRYVTVEYDRGFEHNKYTYSNIPKWVVDEQTVRRYINK